MLVGTSSKRMKSDENTPRAALSKRPRTPSNLDKTPVRKTAVEDAKSDTYSYIYRSSFNNDDYSDSHSHSDADSAVQLADEDEVEVRPRRRPWTRPTGLGSSNTDIQILPPSAATTAATTHDTMLRDRHNEAAAVLREGHGRGRGWNEDGGPHKRPPPRTLDKKAMGFFSKKKKDGNANPYAQDGAQVPFSNPLTPYQQARNDLAQGRPAGLSSSTAPTASNTPPPSYHSPSIASSRYGDEKYGNQKGYGTDRYGSTGSGPAPGGYGGFNSDAGNNRSQASAAQPAGGDRNPALFGNAQERYNPYGGSKPQAQSGPQGDEYGGYGAQRELTEEEQAEAQAQAHVDEAHGVRNESIAALQRTLAMGNQAFEQATGTLVRIDQQDEMMFNANKNLDSSLAHARDGQAKTKTLRKLNDTPFFIPVEPGRKAQDKLAEMAVLNNRQDREQREQTLQAGYTDRQKMEQDMQQLARASSGPRLLGAGKPANKFALEDDEEGQAQEEQIGGLMDDVLVVSKNLNMASSAMTGKLERSIAQINDVSGKVDLVDDRVRRNREMLNHIR